MFESKHECMISNNIMCKNRTMTNGIDCKLKENFTFRTPTTKMVTKYNYSHQIHCRRAHPFKGFIQNDCPSYRNSNLVRSEVFKYVIYVSNIWSQNITTVKHCDMSRKHDKNRLRKQTHVTIYKELQMQKNATLYMQQIVLINDSISNTSATYREVQGHHMVLHDG